MVRIGQVYHRSNSRRRGNGDYIVRHLGKYKGRGDSNWVWLESIERGLDQFDADFGYYTSNLPYFSGPACTWELKRQVCKRI